jgi:hypothetical protein
VPSVRLPSSSLPSPLADARTSILNLRATRDRAPTVKKFSSTLHKWVDDFHITSPADAATVASRRPDGGPGTGNGA